MRKYIAKKLKSKEGFTLAELLIVVAIIAILAMISIPIFTSKLTDAKKNTDTANERSAKAAAVADYMNHTTGGTLQGAKDDDVKTVTYYYDATKGIVKETKDGIENYGQAKTGVIKVTVHTDTNQVDVDWE